MYSIENVSFAYGDEPVVKGITLEISGGEMTGLIGPNGSGKTTLLKLLSKVLTPDNGVIKFNGTDIGRISQKELARSVAVVSQMELTYFPFTVAEIVLMGRNPYLKSVDFEGRHDIDVAKNAMRMTDVLRFENRRIDEVSAGERQRVFIARALTQEPKVLLLDECTSNLDIKHQIEIYELVRNLNVVNRITVLTVSHDINLAVRYCKRLIMMKDGGVYCDGNVSAVLNEKNIREVFGVNAEFLRSEKHNQNLIVPYIL